MPSATRHPRSTDPADFAAVLFDLDGVLTPTADIHQRAWAHLFGAFLAERTPERPYTDADYFAWIDGKPRYDGVAALLASRGIELPWGEAGDPPGALTVCGLGNRKNTEFDRLLRAEGVRPYPGVVDLLDRLAGRGVAVAVVSSSKNATAVLAAADLVDRFTVVVDGLVAAAEHLPGKPAPDTFSHAARALGATDAESVVVEDALSGVAAGRAGDFGLVLGVDRGAGAEALLEAGADVVVAELTELLPPDRPFAADGADSAPGDAATGAP